MPRKAEFIFPPKRCEWPILSSLIIHEAFFEVPLILTVPEKGYLVTLCCQELQRRNRPDQGLPGSQHLNASHAGRPFLRRHTLHVAERIPFINSSQSRCKLGNGKPQGFGNRLYVPQSNIALPALDSSNISSVKPTRRRKGLLRKPLSFSKLAYSLAKFLKDAVVAHVYGAEL
jgi:hypothetical protein